MVNQDLQLDSDFWQFSLLNYARPDVAETCLILQNRYEANVNLVLFCLWLAQTGRYLEWNSIKMHTELKAWRDQHILPVRQRRLLLKQAGLKTSEQIDAYEKIKQQELRAEQVEQAMLFRLAATMPEADRHQQGKGPGVLESRQIARINLQTYVNESVPVKAAATRPLLETLIQLVI